MIKEYDLLTEGTSYYNTTAETYHWNRLKQKINDFFNDALLKKDKIKCLDVGCNIGTDMFMISLGKENRIFFAGTDIAFSAVSYGQKLAKKRKDYNVHFSTHDANDPLPFRESSFDIVICSEVIEHIRQPPRLIKEFNRVLKREGILILSTPNKSHFLRYILNLIPMLKKKIEQQRKWDFSRTGNISLNDNKWDHEAHISIMNLSELKAALNNNGFRVKKVKGSSIFGGASWIDKHPSILGLLILMDSFIDRLPLHPKYQMCMIIMAKKTN